MPYAQLAWRTWNLLGADLLFTIDCTKFYLVHFLQHQQQNIFFLLQYVEKW